MILIEPPPSQFDLRFQVLGIPVRIHPFFWLASLLLARPTESKPVDVLLWVGVVFVSILIHELGHALLARWYGWPPRITLYAFGGLASFQPTYHDTRSQVLIAAAGPGAGFLFIALVMSVVHASGHYVTVEPATKLPYWIFFELFKNQNLNTLINFLLYVNIFWGLMNLLPIFPLDGGRIAQELMIQNNPGDGLRKSLWLSIIVAGGVALLCGVKFGDVYLALLFGYLAFTNYLTLQQLQGRGRPGPW